MVHMSVCRNFPRECELRELAQAAIRRTAPKVLEPQRVSTEAVLREHARILGVSECALLFVFFNQRAFSSALIVLQVRLNCLTNNAPDPLLSP